MYLETFGRRVPLEFYHSPPLEAILSKTARDKPIDIFIHLPVCERLIQLRDMRAEFVAVQRFYKTISIATNVPKRERVN